LRLELLVHAASSYKPFTMAKVSIEFYHSCTNAVSQQQNENSRSLLLQQQNENGRVGGWVGG
jgi:hypothetical protein